MARFLPTNVKEIQINHTVMSVIPFNSVPFQLDNERQNKISSVVMNLTW